MLRKILIADDNVINRMILKNIFSKEYDVIEAGDGKEALELLQRGYKYISAVILDIVMPELSGFEVLKCIRSSVLLSQMPVIIATGSSDEDTEVRALACGANDFITKPYNPVLIRHCLHNVINLRETASIINTMQRDKLTGVYNRETFFNKVEEMIKEKEPGYYVLSSIDVDNFKLVNDQYGAEEGDRILKRISASAKEDIGMVQGIVGRISGDNFAALFPAHCLKTATNFLSNMHTAAINGETAQLKMSFSVGRYIVEDIGLSASTIYDRAYLAKQSIKGRYDVHIAYFDEAMQQQLVLNHEMTNDMEAAISGRQFEVWFQPQYNHSTGAQVGAEALVRWRHPEKGLISPAQFIPLFEQNGFIYELDKFVWEDTCRCLRKWIDAGLDPLPISVNISRYDIFRVDLVDIIISLIKKYRISPGFLRLEITESAFSSSTEEIVAVVNRLIDYGFTIEIDDFGNGYSSLNTLKDVPAQIVKLDMRFLEGDTGQRGGNIVESVVRMVKWLGMSVIAEGVEDKKQADFLKSIGCNYVQGYLYAKPMPLVDYEKHFNNAEKEENLSTIETVATLDNDAFWDPKSMDTLIFNSYIGGACIFEFANGEIELLRINDKFVQELGTGVSNDNLFAHKLHEYLSKEEYAVFVETINKAIISQGEATCETFSERLFGAKEAVFFRSVMRVIARSDNRSLIYCMVQNTTAQHGAEQARNEVRMQLRAITNNINDGVAVTVVKEGKTEILFANEKYYKQLGYTKEQYNAEVKSLFSLVHPEDKKGLQKAAKGIDGAQKYYSCTYRIIRRDGIVRWMHCTASVLSFMGTSEPVQLTVLHDVTVLTEAENMRKELLDNLPYGVTLCEFDGKVLSTVHINKRYWELVERKPSSLSREFLQKVLHPDDYAPLFDEIKSAITQKRDILIDLRIIDGYGEYRVFHNSGRIVPKEDGKYLIYGVYTPADNNDISYREMLSIALSTIIGVSADFAFLKDSSFRYTCVSRLFVEMTGHKSAEEITGKTDYELFDKALADRYRAEDETLLAGNDSIINVVEEIPLDNGVTYYANMSKHVLYDRKGTPIGLYGTGHDVTADHDAFERLKFLTDSIQGGLATYMCKKGDISISYYNTAFGRVFEYSDEEFKSRITENALFMVCDEDRSIILERLNELEENGTPIVCDFRVFTKSNKCRWISLHGMLAGRYGDTIMVNTVFFDVTELKEINEKLRLSEEEYRLAKKHIGILICRFNVADKSATLSAEIAELFNLPERLENLPEGPIQDGKISPETAEAYRSLFDGIINGNPEGTATFLNKIDDKWCWLSARYSTLFASTGEPVSGVISFLDITDQREKEAVYAKWQQFLKTKDPLCYTLFRYNLSQNASFDKRAGALSHLDFNTDVFDFNECVADYAERCVFVDDKKRYIEFLDTNVLLADYYRGNRLVTLDYRENLEKGGVRWLRLTVEMIEHVDSSDVEAFLMYEDISAEKQAEFEMLELMEKDSLTGLYNRKAFVGRINRILNEKKKNTLCALLMFDIDGFKMVNDSFGHVIGDQTLIDIAQTTSSVVRKSDIIGRLGGDEFLICLKDMQSFAEIEKKAKQLCRVLRKSLSVEVSISASIGIAVCPFDGDDFDILYRKADIALYHVKATGKNNYIFYSDEMVGEEPHRNEQIDITTLSPISTKKIKRRMFIVEDDEINRTMLVNQFKDDFIIDTADDGNAALICMQRYKSSISVVLLDLMLPGIDGFTVLEKMRSNSDLENIPVIVVSGVDDNAATLRVIKSGASDFVHKPIDVDLLRLRVESAIAKSENERLIMQNQMLAMLDSESAKYRAVFENESTVMIEYDSRSHEFIFDKSLPLYLAGQFDKRSLWKVLAEDGTADAETVEKMRLFTEKVSKEGVHTTGGMEVILKSPSGDFHSFTFKVIRRTDEYQNGDKMLLTLTDNGKDMDKRL